MSQPESTRISGNWKAIFIGPNPQIRRDLTPLLGSHIQSLSVVDLNTYPSRQQLISTLATQNPNLCFVEVGANQELGVSLVSEVHRVSPKLPVVVVLSPSQSGLVMQCLRQGAFDFLMNPFTAEQVKEVVGKLAKMQPGENLTTPAKIFAVMPAKGGCGATTVASNLAYQWKRLGSKRVLLADMDALAGTLSFLLKIKSNYSFLDVLQRSSDMDADLWKAMVTNRNDVDVLLAPDVMAEGANDLTDAVPVIEYARQAYDVVILDTSGVYGDWNLSQASLCDEILLITTNELTSLQAVQRAFSYLDSNGIGRWKIHLVVNRYDKHIGLTRDVISTALHSDIYWVIPNDYDAVQKALMEGKPVPPATTVGKHIMGLADRLAGRENGQKKGSSLSGLLSLFSRTSS